MKKIIALLLIIVTLSLCFAACADSKDTPVSGKKVAYIMQMEKSEIFEMWSDSAKHCAEALGMQYDAVFCGGSDAIWRQKVEEYAAAGYDGLLLSHGGKDYAYTFLKDITERYPDLKIVTFDTQFADEAGETKTIEGVTQFFQEDAALSTLLLDYICDTLCADKEGPANILKVWKGPEYLAAFDRREVGYAQYEQTGKIHTLETIAPTDLSDAKASVKAVAAEALARYEAGEIDAIWCCYDLYAEGVYEALKEGGYDIPLVSVDICNQDLAAMAEENSNWRACATTNWQHNGEFGMRVLALEMAGEYDKIIDPATGKASAWLELPVSLVTKDMLGASAQVVKDLSDVAGEAYNDRTWMPTAAWMDQGLIETADQ